MKKNLLILLGILLIGLVLRTTNYKELFMYSHDQDLAGWIISDVVENRHIRLIGQETSNVGVFIGPAFYYALIPFYFITNMDPIGGIILSTIIGLASIASVYFVFKNVFSQKVGLIGSFIYATSYYTVFTDREVVPTTPAMLWSIWFFYCIFLVLKKKQKGYILAAFLLPFAWQVNLALILLSPLVLLAMLFSKSLPSIKTIAVSVAILAITASPYLVFELKHGFQQTKSITSSLTTSKNHIPGTSDTKLEKLDRTLQLVYKNTESLFWGSQPKIPQKYALYALMFLSVYLFATKKIKKNTLYILVFWQLLYIGFFTLNPINISEYYINGMNIVWISLTSVFLANLNNRFMLSIILIFGTLNLSRVLSSPINQSGYIERKQIVEEIKRDSIKNNYPCVAVSYITSPGNDMGYRYLFKIAKLHVNQPISQSPVYTIVFPHSKVDRIDKSFGALGLIYPDYKKYKTEDIKKSCEGQNSNLTDPMFGFTK